MLFLSVIIPAYNEEGRISETLFDVDEYLKRQNYEYEIIVVDDGSTDKTAEVVGNLLSRIKNLSLIINEKNRGKGYAVKRGLLAAKGKYRLFMDADNSTSINQIEKLLSELPKCHIAIGSRAVRGAILNPLQTLLRRMFGKIAKTFIQVIIFLPKIKDTQCGFKILSEKASNDILPRCRINGWAFDAEILKIGQKLGYKIREVPVVWKNNPESKVKITGGIKFIFELLTIRFYLLTGKYDK